MASKTTNTEQTTDVQTANVSKSLIQLKHKNGRTAYARDEVQAAAFLSAGYLRAEDIEQMS